MAEFPALPFWVDAYVADTGHLSPEQHGLYLLLLMLMWRSHDCRVPNDDDWIARRLNVNSDLVRLKLRPIIAEFCFPDSRHWLSQKRLRKEWNSLRERSRKASRSSKSRWDREKNHANAMRTHEVENNATGVNFVIDTYNQEENDEKSVTSMQSSQDIDNTQVSPTRPRNEHNCSRSERTSNVDKIPTVKKHHYAQRVDNEQLSMMRALDRQNYSTPKENSKACRESLTHCSITKKTHASIKKERKKKVSKIPSPKKGKAFRIEQNHSGIADPLDPEVELFQRGKAILGKDAGGLIAKVLKLKGSATAALSVILMASTKQNPREWIGAILRGASENQQYAASDYGDRAL